MRLVLGLALVAVLVPVTVIDLERRIIPNAVLGPAALLGVILVAAMHPAALPERLLAGAGAGGFFGIAALASPNGMGMGDAKLAATLGLYLGRAVVAAVVLALLAGVVAGVVIVARRGVRRGRRATMPFGPFLALGAVAAVLAGDGLVDSSRDAVP